MTGMQSQAADGKKTQHQKLSELCEWFLSDRRVELKFVPNTTRRGRLAPEWDFHYWMDGRRITERCLSMLIVIELQKMNYVFQLSRVIAALTELGWRHYVLSQEYPDWMKKEADIRMRRPQGRPRKRPKTIPYEEYRSYPDDKATL